LRRSSNVAGRVGRKKYINFMIPSLLCGAYNKHRVSGLETQHLNAPESSTQYCSERVGIETRSIGLAGQAWNQVKASGLNP
jgi:hypothetical protein